LKLFSCPVSIAETNFSLTIPMYRMAKKSPYPYLTTDTDQYKHAMCCGGIKAHRLEIQKLRVLPHIITFGFPSPHNVHTPHWQSAETYHLKVSQCIMAHNVHIHILKVLPHNASLSQCTRAQSVSIHIQVLLHTTLKFHSVSCHTS